MVSVSLRIARGARIQRYATFLVRSENFFEKNF
jgi:hypothetical protein